MLRVHLTLTKRKKIILVSAILTLFLWFFQLGVLNLWIVAVFVLLIDYALTYWILDFDLKGQERLSLPLFSLILILGLFLSVPIFESMGLFWLLLVICFFSFYFLLLTINILNISTIRPLPLVRAAWASMHLLHFILSSMLFGILFWHGFGSFLVLFLVFTTTFFLSYPSYYILVKELNRGGKPVFYMFFTGLIMTEIAFAFCFLNLPFFIKALSLGGGFYIITGLLEHDLRTNLKRESVYEYLFILTLILFAVFYFQI